MARRWSSTLALLVCGATLTVAGRARAQTDELPVIVSYAAPAECATADAFQQLVATQVARERNPDRPWRFAVTIRHERDYIGTLEIEGGTRELRASSCDEVTAALATIIAMAQPPLRAAPPPPAPPPPAPPPPAPRTPVAVAVVPSVVQVPSAPTTATRRDETRMASPTLLGVGIAIATVGIAAIPFGVLHIVTADAATAACPAAPSCRGQSADGTGIAIIGAGAGLAVGGLVVSVLGLRRKHVSVEAGPIGSTGATVTVTF